MKTVTYDKEKVSLNLARLKKDGKVFEVVVDADEAVKLKGGEDISIDKVVKSQEIFQDANRGLMASETSIKEVFGTSNKEEIIKKIIKDGEIQLTSEYRQRLRDEKRKRILNMIKINGVDPRTNLPHPMTRIENAFEEAKIKIDEFTSEEKQVQEILKKLKVILPIKFMTKKFDINIPTNYASKCYTVLKAHGKIINEKWESDGAFNCKIEIPAGMVETLFDKLNSITHGTVSSNETE